MNHTCDLSDETIHYPTYDECPHCGDVLIYEYIKLLEMRNRYLERVVESVRVLMSARANPCIMDEQGAWVIISDALDKLGKD